MRWGYAGKHVCSRDATRWQEMNYDEEGEDGLWIWRAPAYDSGPTTTLSHGYLGLRQNVG